MALNNNYYAGILKTKIGHLLSELTDLLRDSEDSELLEHLLAVLSSLVHNNLPEVKNHLGPGVKLKEVLLQTLSRLSPTEQKVGACQFLKTVHNN